MEQILCISYTQFKNIMPLPKGSLDAYDAMLVPVDSD